MYTHYSIKPQRHTMSLGFAIAGGVLVAALAFAVTVLLTGKDGLPYAANLPGHLGGQKMTPNATTTFTKLYVEADTNASRTALSYADADPAAAAAMEKLASLPQSRWFTSAASLQEVNTYVQAANDAKAMPVLVAYNIPDRDCGGYSAGGSKDATQYKAYIGELASRIANRQAIVILEPDALASIDAKNGNGQTCLTPRQQNQRYELLRFAVDRLKQQPKTLVYIDAGHSAWNPDHLTIAGYLREAGVARADGFSLNVSNFQATAAETAYGQAIGKALAGKHYVIDTSRNGHGPYINTVYPATNWCNPPDRALGHYPTLVPGGPDLLDAYLFIKAPGESDGQDPDTAKCFGGLIAGAWWPEYALGLVARWPHDQQPR